MDRLKPIIACSTIHNGPMKPEVGESVLSVLPTRQVFLEKQDISPADTTLVRLVYEGDIYTRFYSISAEEKGDGIIREPSRIADALVVTEPNHALFLPLADCIGMVVYHPTKPLLMVSHLGRHNLEQFGGTKSIEYLVKQHDVDPSELKVWLSPAAGKEYYPLFVFDNRSLHDVAVEQLLAAGVQKDHIDISPIDSAADQNYFSHSQFLQGNRPTDGRHAIVAMLTTL